MKRLLLAGLLLYTSHSFAQDPTSTYFDLTRNGFNEKNAIETTAFVEQRWRLPGNKGFNETIYYVEGLLKKAGFVQEQNNESEALLTYRIEKRPMKQNAWDPINAIVSIEGEQEPLLEFKTNRNMITISSASSPPEGTTAEVVYLNPIDISSIDDKDIKGKIVFSEIGTGRLFNVAINSGALGVLGYSMPTYTQPEKHQTSIQFSGINNPDGKGWAINLSYKAKERLKSALAKGPVKLNVKVETNTYPSNELTIIANVKGSTNPNERFVYSAHVQEPGANDNASGVGTLAEMARLTADLVKSGKLTPQRTLTFLWGDEIVSTQRYIKEDSERANGIMWGMSLDMVGENTEKTGGSFLIEKMPDPSAIWTRGEDKHTEWGAGDVKEDDLFPHYYNDLVMKICSDQGRHVNWTVNYNPFEGGSDHTPFIRSKIPGLLMWHFTDVFYHTDNDRLDKVSATTMKNVGISALTTAYTLVTADESTALFVINEVKTAALKRLKTEFDLSKQAIANGKSTKQDEKHILSTWGKYYTDALATIPSIPIKTETTRIGSAIKFAVLEVEKQTNQDLEALR
ncbi:M28 family peptidase [Pedobacter sp. B4-66]|uniref:M28 family peptidase n=1 Tax=Pedobacter sp. B4-66 TaxID=2817280 RepID=UPI001BD9F48C|nr:M28 family peptidase [Pedobacter sp. B4-66]